MEIEGTRGSRPYAMAQKLNGWKQLARSNYHQGTQFVAEPRYNYFLAAGRLVPVPNAVMQRQNILPVPVLLGKKTGDVEEEMKIKLSRMVGGSMHRFLPSPSSAEEEKSFLRKKNCLLLRFLQFGKRVFPYRIFTVSSPSSYFMRHFYCPLGQNSSFIPNCTL